MPKQKPAVVKSPRCPECNSSQTVTRKTDRKRWCRKCLAEWDIDAKPKAKVA